MKKYYMILALLVSFIVAYSPVAKAQIPSQAVVAPVIPETMSFAGEAVPLDNVDTYESLQREMMVTCYMHSRTYLTLLRTKRYFAVIEPILKQNDIPDDFKYLCMAESGLIPEIVSSAGAAGLWQIMPETARMYGLETGSQVDERYHIEKSTEVACQYLKEAYEIFGSWTLAAASYNVGMNGVLQRITAQGVDCYYDAFFPQETLRYVFRILSFKLLVENPELYGFIIEPDSYYKPFDEYTEVTVEGVGIDWNMVAQDNGTTYKQMRLFNPWIREYKYDNKDSLVYTVRIPDNKFRTSFVKARPSSVIKDRGEIKDGDSQDSDGNSSSKKEKKSKKKRR